MLKAILNKYEKISLIVAFIAVNNIIAVTFSLGLPYYFVMFGAFLYSVKKETCSQINLLGLLFLLCCALSIIINDIPSFFNPWMRLVTFIMVTLLVGPFVKSNYLNCIRIEVFNLIQLFLQPIVLISFATYFFHISFSRNGVGFAGITAHTMILAPICGITFSWSLYKMLITDKGNMLFRYYWIGLSIVCFLCVLLTASRIALIATVTEFVIFSLYKFRDNLSAFFKWAIVLTATVAFTAPLWMPYTVALQEKNASSMRAGGLTSSRERHWEQRMAEFESNPILGVGFGAISTDLSEGSNFDLDTGKVETGSSWLSVLSMIGILGFLLFLGFFIRAIKQLRIIAYEDELLSLLLFIQSIFWAVHMIAEGYILSAGGFLFFNVWLLLGTIEAYKDMAIENG